MLNCGTTKCALEAEGPNLEKVGPRRVEPRRVEPRRVEPRRVGGPKISRFFSILRHNFLYSFSLLGSLRGILVVFEAPGP